MIYDYMYVVIKILFILVFLSFGLIFVLSFIFFIDSFKSSSIIIFFNCC